MISKIVSSLTLLLCIHSAYGYDTLSQFKTNIFFPNDEYFISEKEETLLEEIVQKLTDQSNYKIELIGYASTLGSDDYNLKLSKNRANTIKKFLIKKGLKSQLIEWKYFGEQQSTISESEDILSRDRKVEVRVTLFGYQSIDRYFSEKIKEQTETFIVNNQNLKIKSKKGTIIEFPQDAFIDAKGKPITKSVEIKLIEVQNAYESMLNGTMTMSDTMLIETGGMMKIEAFADYEELKLAPNKSVKIAMISQSKNRDMNVFYGEKTQDNSINWKQSLEKFENLKKPIPLNIDKSMLEKISLDKYVELPRVDSIYFGEMPSIPVRPTYPNDPYYRSSESITSDANIVEKVITPQKVKMDLQEKREKNDYLNEKREDRYDRRVEEYNNRLIAYQIAKLNYHRDSVLYIEKLTEKIREVEAYNFNKLEKYYVHRMSENIEKFKRDTIDQFNSPYADFYVPLHNISNFREDKFASILGQKFCANNMDRIDRIISRMPRTFIKQKHNFKRSSGFYIKSSAVLDSLNRKYGLTELINNIQSQIIKEKGRLGLLKIDDLPMMISSVSKLGWINCDRFRNTPAIDKLQLIVNNNSKAKIYVIFEDIKSIINMKQSSEISYTEKAIPRFSNISIIGLDIVDGKPLLAKKSIRKIANDTSLVLDFKEVSYEEIENTFKQFNRF